MATALVDPENKIEHHEGPQTQLVAGEGNVAHGFDAALLMQVCTAQERTRFKMTFVWPLPRSMPRKPQTQTRTR